MLNTKVEFGYFGGLISGQSLFWQANFMKFREITRA